MAHLIIIVFSFLGCEHHVDMMARFGSVVLNYEFILEIAFKQMGRIKSERSLFHEETHGEDYPDSF